MRAHRVLGFLLFGGSVWAQQYVISTIAGGAPPATPLTATSASVGDPTRMATDAAGNVYFGSLHSVFKVDAAGTLTRFAGNGRAGNSGDGGPATAAQFNFPMGIAIDGGGNVFVADRDASVVRKIAANGIITTVAGTRNSRASRATAARRPARRSTVRSAWRWMPAAISISPTPAIRWSARCRRTARSRPSRAPARAGYLGDGGAARSAWLNGPEGVAVDAAGNLYIADTFNGRIRRVAGDGTITTVAGVGSTGIFSRRRRSGDERRHLAAARRGGGPRGKPVHRGLRQQPDPYGHQRRHHDGGGQNPSGTPTVEGEAGDQRPAGRPHGRDDRSQRHDLLRGGGHRVGHGSGTRRLQGVEGFRRGILTTLAGNGITELLGRRTAGDGGAVQRAGGSGGRSVRRDLHCGHAESAGACAWRRAARSTPWRARESRDSMARSYRRARRSSTFRREWRPTAQGNWYVADTVNNRVRKVQPGGNLLTIAGNGNASYFGDGGQGDESQREPAGRRGGGCGGQRLHRGHAGQCGAQADAGWNRSARWPEPALRDTAATADPRNRHA